MRLQRLIVPVMLCAFAMAIHAQEAAKYSRDQNIRIPSAFLNETRQMSIFLPDDYHFSDTKYPVLYLLDGGAHLQHAGAAVDYLSNRGIIPDIIVVAIHNIDRNRDFSPVHVDNVPTSGGADKFLKFLSNELVPHVDGNYRTSGFNILLGHSFGGTFIGYTLLTRPRLFDAFLAVSPYLMYADDMVVNMASEKLKPFNKDKYFYMTVGDEERYFETLEEYASIMKEKAGESVKFKYVKMMDEDHGTTPYLSLFSGLKFIFSGWQLPVELLQTDLETIDLHFADLTNRYGVEVTTPEEVINALGYRYLQAGDPESAIATFKKNVARYPESANVYDNLGEAYEAQGNTKLAAKNYGKAVELGEKKGDVNQSVYRANLERVTRE